MGNKGGKKKRVKRRIKVGETRIVKKRRERRRRKKEKEGETAVDKGEGRKGGETGIVKRRGERRKANS